MSAAIAERVKPAPVTVGKRWVVERTNAWHNAHKKQVDGLAEVVGEDWRQ